MVLRLRISLLLVLLFGVLGSSSQEDPVTEPVEAEAVFDVLSGINYEIDWRAVFPGDPCTGGPHGIVCEVGTEGSKLHVVELNLGWVSEYANNPPCSENATVHPSISKFTMLRKLFFYKCFVHSPVEFPTQVFDLWRSLEHLTFQNNPALVGRIPRGIGNLTKLERLVMSGNALEGEVPDEVAYLVNLKQMVVSHNRLGMVLPDSIGQLTRLVILDASNNAIGGQIPLSLYSLTRLQKLDLGHNLLTGTISSQVSNLKQLKFLDLSSNQLSGRLPVEIRELTGLQYLSAGDNLLAGTVPDIWEPLKELIAVRLSNSRYDGPIPGSLAELKKLNFLSLDSNRLSGKIPNGIGNMPSLYHVNFSSNMLVGPVPFVPSLIRKLGRNLIVRNNTGLCYDPGSTAQVPGLEPCGTLSAGTFAPTSLPVQSGSVCNSCLWWWISCVLVLCM